MNVKEIISKWNIMVLYSTDKELIEKYGGNEVLTYAYSDFGGAFVFKGARKYFAFVGGARVRSVGKVIMLIKNAEFNTQLPSADLERYAFLLSV